MLNGVRNPGGVSCLRYPPGSFCFRGVCCVFLFGFANSQNPISATHCPCQLQTARRAGLPLPERGHTGRHKAKGGGYHSPLRFRSWWAHMCKVCPRAALGSGDFPCKWHFDIKMRCLRHQERTEYGVVFCQELMPLKSPIMGCPFGWNCAIFPTNKDLVELCVCGDHAGTVDDDGFESLRNRKERIQRGHITEVPLHDFHLLFRFYDHLQF